MDAPDFLWYCTHSRRFSLLVRSVVDCVRQNPGDSQSGTLSLKLSLGTTEWYETSFKLDNKHVLVLMTIYVFASVRETNCAL